LSDRSVVLNFFDGAADDSILSRWQRNMIILSDPKGKKNTQKNNSHLKGFLNYCYAVLHTKSLESKTMLNIHHGFPRLSPPKTLYHKN
jgi:hypothetical protein